MNNITILPAPTTELSTIDQHTHDYAWLDYFSPQKALQQVAAHIATLGSTGNSDHTKQIYNSGLTYFFEWCHADAQLNHPFPDSELVTSFIAHLMHDKPNHYKGTDENGNPQRGLSARTVASKYLAPLRLYLQKLRLQRIQHGEPMQILQYKNYLDEALAIKNPTSKKSTNQSALYAHGTRLTKAEVDQLFMSCDINTLKGTRDYALLYVAFTVALRVTELKRLTLAHIRQGENGYECTVPGKRNNEDAVDMDPHAVKLIHEWVEAFNQAYPKGDPRRITANTPIWQPLRRGDNRYKKRKASKGMSQDGIAHIISSRTEDTLGFSISPHDARRSYAAIARVAGVEMHAIQRQLRHASIATTQTYCGPLQDLSESRLTNKVKFAQPPRRAS